MPDTDWSPWIAILGGRLTASGPDWCHVTRPGGAYLIVVTPAAHALARHAYPATLAFTRKELGFLSKISPADREVVLSAKRKLGGWVQAVVHHPHQGSLV